MQRFAGDREHCKMKAIQEACRTLSRERIVIGVMTFERKRQEAAEVGVFAIADGHN